MTTGQSETAVFNTKLPPAQSGITGYHLWLQSLGLPVHRGYFIEDLRKVELGEWPERECKAAFLQLSGQEGVSEARVTEVPPGATLPPLKFALDETVYVVEGRGLTTVTRYKGDAPRTFEWQKHSMFMLPRNCTHQISNASGTERALLLHYNYLPLSMELAPEPDFFFNSPYEPEPPQNAAADLYEEARATQITTRRGTQNVWFGNFFPDMRTWDKLQSLGERGAGGHSVTIQFPESPIWSHMSVFPAKTYKKAHRHGPGVVIVIPAGEGFSIMWPEGEDKVFIPWHEASVFVPPSRWYHQHFNVGAEPGRYLAMHAPRSIGWMTADSQDPANQIEYTDEDPWVRQTFESELAKRGIESLMPEQAYVDPNFEWDYGDDD